MLRKLIRENSGSPASAAAAKELDALVAGISPQWHYQTREYRKIEDARSRIAELVEKLQREKKLRK